jgi:hypothetical protein
MTRTDYSDKFEIVPGKVYDLLFPYSEAACHAGIAGTVQTVRVSDSGLGVHLTDCGTYFTAGEAGIYTPDESEESLYAYGFYGDGLP